MSDEVSFVSGHIVIRPKNKMTGTIQIIGVGSSTLSSSITVTKFNSLQSHAIIYSDSVIEDISFPPRFGNQRKGKVEILERNSLSSSISVSPRNIMSGIVDIIEPPTYVTQLTSIKDAFVRDGIKTLNYGSEESMIVGYNATKNEKYRSLVQFDLSTLPENIVIKKAELKLFNPILSPVSHEIGIYTVASQWEENGVTWNNQPASESFLISKDVSNQNEYISFDISQKVIDWNSGQSVNRGLIIRAINETINKYEQFATRENSDGPPILEITYKDKIIYSAGRLNLESNLFVYQVGEKNLTSSITIREYGNEQNLKSSIHVHNFNYWMESNLFVSRQNLLSNMTVRQNTYDQITSSIAVRVKQTEELSGSTFINAPVRAGNIFILFRTDIDSSIAVQRSDVSLLQSNLTVSHLTRQGNISVPYRDNLNSSILVRRSDESTFESSIFINTPSRPGRIFIPFRGDLNSLVTVQRHEKNSLSSSLTVSHLTRKANIYVYHRDNMDSSIAVQRHDNSSITGKITISTPEKQANLFVLYRDNLTSAVVVRQNESSDLHGNITVSHLTRQGNIYIPYRDSLSSTIQIARTETNDLQSHVFINTPLIPSNVYVPYREDVNAAVTIRRSDKSDLISHIAISTPNLMGSIGILFRNDITSAIAVSRHDDVEFTSHIAVIRQKIFGDITVRRTEKSDFSSNIKIRQTDANNFSGEIAVIRKQLPSRINVVAFSRIPSSITVRQKDSNNFNGDIRILNRKDIPGNMFVIYATHMPSNMYLNSGYLKSHIAVPAYGDSEINGSLVVRVKWVSEMTSTIFVGGDNLPSGYVFIM